MAPEAKLGKIEKNSGAAEGIEPAERYEVGDITVDRKGGQWRSNDLTAKGNESWRAVPDEFAKSDTIAAAEAIAGAQVVKRTNEEAARS